MPGGGDRRRVCLLTGAGGTLGSAFCRLHAARYNIVAVHGRRMPDAASQVRTFFDPLAPNAGRGENAHPVFLVGADLTDSRDITRVVEIALARFDRIDVVVNAAVHSVWARMVESDHLLASMDRQFRVNTMLPLRLSIEVARQFWSTRHDENVAMRRNVVNVSSIAGVNVYSGSGQSVYAATKAALNHLTRHMADEFAAFGVRVNATAPDSFPRVIPVETAVASVVRLDDGDMTGRILVVGANGETVV
jgi:NAD(P)-dependent dehydrogenase (short-subunit alcohol dehydrogenase family)